MFEDFDLSKIFGGPLGMNLFGGPGGPGGGSMFKDLPELPVANGAPTLLKAGNDDYMPPPMPMPGAGLMRAGMEGSRNAVPVGAGPSRGIVAGDVATTGAVNSVAAPPAAAAPPLPGPGVTRPAVDPDRNKPFPNVVTRPIPNSGGGPDERRPAEPVPIVPPRIDTSAPAAGGRPVAGPTVAAPAAPAAAPPGTPQEEPNQSALQKFLSEMGNVKPGPQAPLPHPANMSYGAPHIPQGGADLLAKIMAEHAGYIPKIGPVPKAADLRRYGR